MENASREGQNIATKGIRRQIPRPVISLGIFRIPKSVTDAKTVMYPTSPTERLAQRLYVIRYTPTEDRMEKRDDATIMVFHLKFLCPKSLSFQAGTFSHEKTPKPIASTNDAIPMTIFVNPLFKPRMRGEFFAQLLA
jgi:hypothetical protein